MTVPAEKQVSLASTLFEPLLHRHPTNPVLISKDWPYPINSVFNAGATMLADGTTLLLCRVEDLAACRISALRRSVQRC